MRVVLFWVFIGSFAASAESVRFEDLDQAVMKHLRVQAARDRVEASQSQEGHFSRSYFPKIHATLSQERFRKGSNSWETQPQAGAELSVNLFNGGRDVLEEDVRSANTALSLNDWNKTYQDQLFFVRQDFLNILFERKLIEILENHQALNEKNNLAAERKIKSGVTTKIDRLEFRMQAVSIDQSLARARSRAFIVLNRLRLALNRPDLSINSIEGELTHAHDWKKEVSKGEGRRVELVEFDLNRSKNESLSKKESRWWSPSLDVFAGFHQNNRLEEEGRTFKDRQEAVFGLRLNLDFGNALSSRAEAQSLQARAIAYEKERVFEEKRLNTEYESSLNELDILHGLVHEAEQNVKRGESYFKMTASQYRRGTKNSLDMLSATERFIGFLTRKAEIDRDFELTRAALLRLIAVEKSVR